MVREIIIIKQAFLSCCQRSVKVLTVDTAVYFGHMLSRICHGDTERLIAKIGCLLWPEF